jgi:VRR-NUC domain
VARSPEHELQKAYFQWARLHPEARRAYAIPNGGQRNAVVAAKLKAEGVRKGVLDVHLPLARGGAHGLYIEHKAGKNRLSEEQAEEVDRLVADGYTVAVVWDDPGLSIDLTKRYLLGEAPPGLVTLKPAARPSAPGRRVRRAS